MKSPNDKTRKISIAVSLVLSLLLVQGAMAASAYPRYRLSPAAPHVSDSVTFFIAKGMYPNSCIPSYAASFTTRQIPIECKTTRAPCPNLYRIAVEYDSISRKIDSLIAFSGAQSVCRYIYNNDTVYYVVSPCCDRFNYLYNKNGVLLCAPDGGESGHGDGRCPDFFQKATDKTSMGGIGASSYGTGGSACLQVLTDYGPLFRFGKLAAGSYQVYDARDSAKQLFQFTVSAAATAVRPDAKKTAAPRRTGDFSLGLCDGSIVLSLAKPERLAITAFRPDGRSILRIGRDVFSAGLHRISLGKGAPAGVFIFRVDGAGWSRTMVFNGAQGQ
jgi:hypothetical protein